MIGLVLQAAGKLAVARDGHRLLLQVQAGHDGVCGTAAVSADTRHGQATLLSGLFPADLGQHRVDHVTKLFVDVVRESREAGPDLVRCEPGAPWHLHRVEQVGYQLGECVVEADDAVAGRAQHGVTKQAQRPHGHRATGSAPSESACRAIIAPPGACRASVAGRVLYWLSAVSLPIRSSTSLCQASSASMRSSACSTTRSSATV